MNESSTSGCEIGTAGPEGIVLLLDPAIYRISAIKKAAYKVAGRCHVLLDTMAGGRVKAILQPKEQAADPQLLVGDFCNEVLDQELREVVAQETEAVRNLILAQAFSATSLLDEQADTGDFEQDPKGITRPASTAGGS